MESKRQQKVGRQIQKDMGDIFQKEAKHLVSGVFVTVTVVRMTPDLGLAKVYLSFLPEKDKHTFLKNIQVNTKLIRQKLGDRVKNQLRIVPEIQFFLDDTAEYVSKMDDLFAGIVIPPAPLEDEEDDDTN
jgi:ribosome-binding factor A